MRQNLDIALTYAKHQTPKQERIAEALTRVGLPGTQNRRIYSMSGGEQQRVAVARLLLKPCDIILADEPTGSLDAENRDTILELLVALNKAGKTIVIATHDDTVAAACSRTLILPR